VVFPQTPLIVSIALFLGGTWVDVTQDVLARDQVAITWGRQDWASTADTTKAPMTFNNGPSKVAPGIVGRYSRKNPRSDLYGLLGRNTPVRVQVTTPSGAVVDRFEGFISSWPTRWDLSGNDVYATVQANGIRRRLAQGTKRLKDPLRRFIEVSGPLTYWPLTDGETAIEGTELVLGSQPMRALGENNNLYQGQVDWGKGSLAPWLEPVIQLPDDAQGRLTAAVPARNISSWSFDHVLVIPSQGNLTAFEITDMGQPTDLTVQSAFAVQTDGFFDWLQLRVTERSDSASSSALLASIDTPGIYDGRLHHLRLTVADDPSGYAWTLYLDGESVASGTRAVPYEPVSRLTLVWSTIGVDADHPGAAMAAGHFTYWGPDAPTAERTWQAAQGWARELAGRRIERLCAEQGVPLMVNGDLDHTPAMGPQKPGAFLDLLQSAADVDGGALYESRDERGLAYRTRRSKYNQGL
jgi:hypothetical protein